MMRRAPLYGSSRRRSPGISREPEARKEAGPDEPARGNARFREAVRRHERIVLLAAGALFALLAVVAYEAVRPDPREITQEDLEAAVIYTLDNLPPDPSPARTAHQIIRPSVVRVRQFGLDPADTEELGVGTGVVIVETGIILTNLHVVAGAERVGVVFADGLESEASVISVQPENDLAVLQAATVPDDLVPATLTTTADLELGDRVIAVGNPFGIGPSVSSGVISGLGRNYFSSDGERLLTNLIQFDAAVNPGNSGGPLVNDMGEVVGIVTAIFNPTDQRVFIGIGFAVPIETAAAAAGESPF